MEGQEDNPAIVRRELEVLYAAWAKGQKTEKWREHRFLNEFFYVHRATEDVSGNG